MILTSGPTADALLSTTSALATALIAAGAALIIAVMQLRGKPKETDVAAAWREQAEELSDRLEAANESRRQSDASRIAQLEKALELRDRTIAQLTGVNPEDNRYDR